MNILIGYGFSPTTTGRYIEEAFPPNDRVTYVGRADGRAGYASDVDLVNLVQKIGIRPDLFLYVDSGHSAYLPRNIEKLECPTAAYLIDVHLGTRLRRPLAGLFDYVFLAQRDYIEQYRLGVDQHAEWLPLACDPAVHRPMNLERLYDVGFVGRADPAEPRSAMLHALQARYSMNDYHRPYTREEMATVYNRSRIVFNHSIRDDLNMRVFEAMACGALLVTNRIGNGLLELFEDGKHLVTYETQEEMLARVAFYLEHEDAREAIAREGQSRVLSEHTYACRAERILSVVFRDAPGARGPLRDASESRRIAQYAELYSKFRLLDASFETLKQAHLTRQSRLAALAQFGAALLRRAKYG
ncbi:MAG: glycosyltransferase [Rudaea sp.]